MSHLLVRNFEVRERVLGEISDCHDTLDQKQLQQPLEKGRTDAELRGRRHAIRERISFHEWMKRERIPQHRQRLYASNRCPHHRRTGLGRHRRARRRFSITRTEVAEHDRLAREGDAC